MPNINDSFFDGYYKEIWKTIIPDELTVKEVDFMIPYFSLQPGSKVLDLKCGYGRHAIGLARKGIRLIQTNEVGSAVVDTVLIREIDLLLSGKCRIVLCASLRVR